MKKSSYYFTTNFIFFNNIGSDNIHEEGAIFGIEDCN